MSIALQNINRRRLIRIIKKVQKEKWEFVFITSPPGKPNLFNICASRKMWDKETENLFKQISIEQKKEGKPGPVKRKKHL